MLTYYFVLFFLLALSSVSYLIAKRLQVPYTVFLVVIGVVLGALSLVPGFGFFTEFKLTPELLFYIFLPTLIFESAYNINIRRVMENNTIIWLFAILSLVISAGAIAFLLSLIFPAIGLEVPFIILLLFGALISATDPVAVLALFKEYGAPRRLSLIFEGESLFNDATAVALFLIVLEIAMFGYKGVTSISEGMLTFSTMIVGGIAFGLLMGGVFTRLISMTKSNEMVSIVLTVVLAHTTFISSEAISHYAHFGDFHLIISSIIATTVASLVMGNYGRSKISPHAEEFVEKFWGIFAFIANSLVFILIGLIFVELPANVPSLIIPIGITILVVAFARALSIYPVAEAYNAFAKEEKKVPRSWQHLLSWGSLRGALAITMVLLIPSDFTVPGWALPYSVQEFLLALTVGCIFATLFIKATTINYFIKKLGLDALTALEKLEYAQARALIHRTVLARLDTFHAKGYIDANTYTTLTETHRGDFAKYCADCSDTDKSDHAIMDRTLRLHAIGIERKYLKDLFAYDEITEPVYKRIAGKLTLQFEAIEKNAPLEDLSKYKDKMDVFEIISDVFLRFFVPWRSRELAIEEQYMYYRAQTIISRKVLKELDTLTDDKESEMLLSLSSLNEVKKIYETFKDGAKEKMRNLETEHPEIIHALNTTLAKKGIAKVEEHILEELSSKELITPKLVITIKNDLEREDAEAHRAHAA